MTLLDQERQQGQRLGLDRHRLARPAQLTGALVELERAEERPSVAERGADELVRPRLRGGEAEEALIAREGGRNRVPALRDQRYATEGDGPLGISLQEKLRSAIW